MARVNVGYSQSDPIYRGLTVPELILHHGFPLYTFNQFLVRWVIHRAAGYCVPLLIYFSSDSLLGLCWSASNYHIHMFSLCWIIFKACICFFLSLYNLFYVVALVLGVVLELWWATNIWTFYSLACYLTACSSCSQIHCPSSIALLTSFHSFQYFIINALTCSLCNVTPVSRRLIRMKIILFPSPTALKVKGASYLKFITSK